MSINELNEKREALLFSLKNPQYKNFHAAFRKELADINAQIAATGDNKTSTSSQKRQTTRAKSKTGKARSAKKAATAKKSAGATAPKKNRTQTKPATFRKIGARGGSAAARAAAKKATEKPAKTKAAPKTKTAKTVKEKPQKSEFAGNYVENIDTEKKLLGRVLKLEGKNSNKAELEAILRAFNTAKTNRTIRKDSVHAGILEKVYNFILVTNSELRRADSKTPKIAFKPETLAALQNVVNQDAVFPSILVLRKYVNYQGKKPTKNVLDNWFKAATKIKSTDKYHAKVQEAMRIIRIYEAAKSPNVFIPKTALNGLAGLLGK